MLPFTDVTVWESVGDALKGLVEEDISFRSLKLEGSILESI